MLLASTVTSQGQIRDALGIKAGDRVAFVQEPDGRFFVEPETVDIRSLRGIIKPRRRGVSVEEMNEAIRRAGTRT